MLKKGRSIRCLTLTSQIDIASKSNMNHIMHDFHFRSNCSVVRGHNVFGKKQTGRKKKGGGGGGGERNTVMV